MNYEDQSKLFDEIDIVFYCLGAYTGTVPPDEFRVINVDYPLHLAKAVHSKSPNAISNMNFKAFYAFRPGYIYPITKRKEPNFFYVLSRYIYPFIKLLGKNLSITDRQLAKVMFSVGLDDYSKEILENKDMRELFKKNYI